MLLVVGHPSACLTNRIRPVLSVRLKTPPTCRPILAKVRPMQCSRGGCVGGV